MRKLAALLLAVTLLAPALVLAQDPTGTPAPGDTSAQPAPQDNVAVSAPGVLDRAVADLNASQFEQAVIDSSLFILLNPTFPRGYFVRGVAYQNLKKTSQALDDLSKALPLAQTNPALQAAIYGVRGQVYIGSKQPSKAVDDLSSAIKIAPTGDLYALRAQILMSQLDYSAAIPDLDKAIQLLPNENSLYLLRGSAYSALGSDPDAAADYLKWISAQQGQVLTGQPIDVPASIRLDMATDKIYSVPFNATKGQKVSIVVANVSGNVDPLIVLLDPSNRPLKGNDDYKDGDTTSVISNFTIPAAGVYNLIVSHAGGGADGQVVLQIRGQ